MGMYSSRSCFVHLYTKEKHLKHVLHNENELDFLISWPYTYIVYRIWQNIAIRASYGKIEKILLNTATKSTDIYFLQ